MTKGSVEPVSLLFCSSVDRDDKGVGTAWNSLAALTWRSELPSATWLTAEDTFLWLNLLAAHGATWGCELKRSLFSAHLLHLQIEMFHSRGYMRMWKATGAGRQCHYSMLLWSFVPGYWCTVISHFLKNDRLIWVELGISWCRWSFFPQNQSNEWIRTDKRVSSICEIETIKNETVNKRIAWFMTLIGWKKKRMCISVSDTIHLILFTFSGSDINFPWHQDKTVESPLVTHPFGGSTEKTDALLRINSWKTVCLFQDQAQTLRNEWWLTTWLVGAKDMRQNMSLSINSQNADEAGY